MTTAEMMSLPIGTRVVSVATGKTFEALEAGRNDYRRDFRAVGVRGLSRKITAFQGKKIAIDPAAQPEPRK